MKLSLSSRRGGAEKNIWTQETGCNRGWRKLSKAKTHSSYFSLDNVRMEALTRMRSVGRETPMREKKTHAKFW
jgi:hypothetical protein